MQRHIIREAYRTVSGSGKRGWVIWEEYEGEREPVAIIGAGPPAWQRRSYLRGADTGHGDGNGL